jgi:hypothetical protein
VALEHVFLLVLSFPLLITIPPLLYTHLSPPHEVCDSPDQAAHYHTLGAKLGASSLTRHWAGLGAKVALVQGLVDSSCEHGNEPPGFIKGGKYLDQLREYQL